ncbi:hypothetical protein ACIQZB_23130 [Streptomyces sp. NPDC097727]
MRMLGVFPTEDLSLIPYVVVRFGAEPLAVEAGELTVEAACH